MVLLAGAVVGIKGDDVGSIWPSNGHVAAPPFLLTAPLGKEATRWQGAHLAILLNGESPCYSKYQQSSSSTQELVRRTEPGGPPNLLYQHLRCNSALGDLFAHESVESTGMNSPS